MGFQSLVRRKTQLALLAAACDRHEPALLCLRGRDRESETDKQFDSHFLSLQPDGLLLDWAGRPAPRGPVRVKFGHCGQQFILEAMARGVLDLPGRERRTAVKLGLPIRLQRSETRRAQRVSFEGDAVVVATFHGVLDSRMCFESALIDISTRGLSVRTDEPCAAGLKAGDLCWAEFVLPRGDGAFQFVVRVIHARTRESGEAVIGWVFQPGDDGEMDQLQRLATYLESRSASEGKGSEPC